MNYNKLEKSSLLFMLGILFPIIVFLYLALPTIDPDLGWHLVYGKYFWETGTILTSNPFSWSIPNYQWRYLTWMYDAVVYVIYNNFRFFGLSLVSGAIFGIVFYLVLKPYRLNLFLQFIFLLPFIFFMQPVAAAGLRAQLWELLGIAALFYLFYRFEQNRRSKIIFLLFPLMIIWLNSHGSFIIGYFIIAVYVACVTLEFFIQKKLLGKQLRLPYYVGNLYGAVLLSVLGIFVNPYSVFLISEYKNYLPGVRVPGVVEWLPPSVFSDIWLVLLLWTILTVTIVVKNRRSTQSLYKIVLCLIFSYLAFNYRRHVSPYFLVTLPVVLGYFEKKTGKTNAVKKIIVAVGVVTMLVNVLFIRLPLARFLVTDFNYYCSYGPRCSKKAIDYLNSRPKPQRLFNSYNIGGVIIWQNPGLKVFVDGRMDQWKDHGYSPFFDHQRIIYDNDFALFEKYRFDAVYITPDSGLYRYLKKRTDEGDWQIAYQDESAVIFLRKKNHAPST